MATTRQRQAATRANLEKARRARQATLSRGRAGVQPEGRKRARPATRGRGRFFHIEVRPRSEFTTFRTQDVGEKGGIERVAGQHASGSWSTLKWLISKELAHREGSRLIGDTADARRVLAALGSEPVHVRGDRFEARDRPNVPERSKPTPAQKRARQADIRKAKAAVRRRAAA